MFEMKIPINQIRDTVESITNSKIKQKKTISGTEDKVKEILHTVSNKEKK
jgi:hypothetical protein